MSEFRIDPDRLDHECIQQPDLVYQYSRGLANAKKNLQDAQEQFDAYKVAMETRIRDRPDKFNIVKLTEGSVKAALKGAKGYEGFLKTVREAEYALDIAWGYVHAINSKQQSLSDLVKLHGQNYFSEVKTTDEAVKAILKDKARKKGGVRNRDES